MLRASASRFGFTITVPNMIIDTIGTTMKYNQFQDKSNDTHVIYNMPMWFIIEQHTLKVTVRQIKAITHLVFPHCSKNYSTGVIYSIASIY